MDLEGLFHELAHWIVAMETERKAPNLMLTDLGMEMYHPGRGESIIPRVVDLDRSIRREKQAIFLQCWVFGQTARFSPSDVFRFAFVSHSHTPEGWYGELGKRVRAARKGVVRSRMQKVGVQLEELVQMVEEDGEVVELVNDDGNSYLRWLGGIGDDED